MQSSLQILSGKGIILKILALDQAKKCGYAIFNEDDLIDFGYRILGDRNCDYDDILLPATDFVKEMIDLYLPDVVCLEDIQCQDNIMVYQKLAMLKGVLIKLFKEIKMPYLVVPSIKWKSSLKIKGAQRIEQKKNTIKMMEEIFNVQKLTDDEADAIALGYYFLLNRKEEYNE
jgi:Holliday junction resolvasome RuvABC endonuclease subunit